MIISPKLPDIIFTKGRLFPLSEHWLATSVARSASAAGYKRWNLAGEVARAITVYLENDWTQSSLQADVLREMLSRSLHGIGYPDIAKAAVIVPPRLTLSLAEIAERPVDGFQFYALLKTRLNEAVEVQLGGICLDDLRPCCRILAGAKRWNRACDRVQDEILQFCRNHLARVAKGDVDMVIR